MRWSFTPWRGAAASASFIDALGAGPPRESTPIRDALGATSLRSWICLPIRSGTSSDVPVTLPPGRARLVTNPEVTGSETGAHHDRNTRRCSSRRAGCVGPERHDDVDLSL